VGTIGSRWFELLFCNRRVLAARISLTLARALYCVEVARACTTPDLFAAGILVADIGSNALPLSYAGISPAAGIEPAAFGLVDGIRACATPQTFENLHIPSILRAT